MMAEWQLARLMINDFAVARAFHVMALVHWIGGVTMVTTIVLPRAGALADAHAALAAFQAFECPPGWMGQDGPKTVIRAAYASRFSR
jgi:hypothetical protein